MAKGFYTQCNGLKLYTHVIGYGTEIIIAFHGFGQDGSVFKKTALQNNQIIYAIDLFFHGQSPILKKPIDKKSWCRIFNIYLKSNNIDSFHLISFSLGGRFALATYENFKKHIRSAVFIAPDGFHSNFWYRLATFNSMTEKIFKLVMLNPVLLKVFFKIFLTLGFINPALLKFAKSQLTNSKMRVRVYGSWTNFKKIKYTKNELRLLMNEHNPKKKIILGRFDNIIKPKEFRYLDGRAVNIQILNCNHHQLIKASGNYL